MIYFEVKAYKIVLEMASPLHRPLSRPTSYSAVLLAPGFGLHTLTSYKL